MTETISLNQPAPDWMAAPFADNPTGGVLLMSDRLILLRVEDMSQQDVKEMQGRIRVGVYRGKHTLMINLLSRNLSFDLWWSPEIARRMGERPVPADDIHHPMMTIIALDGRNVVRNIRSATLSPEVNMAISRAMNELLQTPSSARDVELEVNAISILYPGPMPEGLFHAICHLGD